MSGQPESQNSAVSKMTLISRGFTTPRAEVKMMARATTEIFRL